MVREREYMVCMAFFILAAFSFISVLILLNYSFFTLDKVWTKKKTIICVVSLSVMGGILWAVNSFLGIELSFYLDERRFLLIYLLNFPIALLIIHIMVESIDEYQKEENLKNLGGALAKTTFFLIVMTVSFLFAIDFHIISNVCLWILIFPFLIFPITVLTIHYLVESVNEYKKGGELKELGMSLALIAVVFIIIGSSIYIPIEYISTPNANQRFVLTLEQNKTGEIELMIPNLEGYERYFPVENYDLIKGEGQVQSIRGGEYIKITTSSKIFQIRYSKEAEMFSEYHGEWDFQYDKLKDVGEEYEDRMMNLSYSSSENTNCRLKMRWEDNYARRDSLFGGHWFDVEADTWIDDRTESIHVRVMKAVA